MRDVPEGPEHRCGHVHRPRQGEEQTLYTWFQSWSPVLMVFGAVQMKVWQQSMGSISTPENIPRLFDMVRVTDESVRPAFYFALRDTLVAADLEQATRVAFQKNKRWRVVTLQGQIIEQAGLFTLLLNAASVLMLALNMWCDLGLKVMQLVIYLMLLSKATYKWGQQQSMDQ